MKIKNLIVPIFTLVITTLILIPYVHGNSTNVAYIYYDDTTTAYSYQSFLDDEDYSTDLIAVSTITTGTLDSYDIIILGPDTGSWSVFQGTNTQVTLINNSHLPIIGLGNGGYAYFGLDGLSLRIGYDEGGTTIDITSIDITDDSHDIFNTPNDVPSGTIQLYTSGSRVYYISISTIPAYIDDLGKISGTSYSYVLVSQDYRYFLWGFEDSPDTMTQIGKDLFINLMNFYSPSEESEIFGYNLFILIGILSVSTIFLLKKKFKN